MRTWILLAVVSLLALGGWFVDTRQSNWVPLREAITSDDTVLDGTTTGATYQFADRGSITKPLNNTCNVAELVFYGANAADLTCNYKIYLYRASGPAMLACTGVLTTGTALKTTGIYYVDTITVTDYWTLGDSGVVVRDSGNNRAATIALDTRGYSYIRVEFDIPASTQVTSISCDMAEF